MDFTPNLLLKIEHETPTLNRSRLVTNHALNVGLFECGLIGDGGGKCVN